MSIEVIQNFLSDYDIEKIEQISNIYEFTSFKIGLESKINQYLLDSGVLQYRDDNFIQAVLQSNENIFQSADVARVEDLRDTITLKNQIYRSIFSAVVKSEKITFLSQEETLGLVQICESGVLELFDTLYREWRRSIPQDVHSIARRGRADLVYGGMKQSHFVSYGEFVDVKKIDSVLVLLNQQNPIHKSLVAMLQAMKDKNYFYTDWVKIEEETEIPLWKNSGNVALCMPMESYIMSEVLVEPEISFFFKLEYTQAKQRNAALAKKVFANDFGMQQVHYFVCIDILFAGMASFVRHAGRNFPNDITLAKKTGKLIYFMPHAFDRIYENGLPLVQKLFSNVGELDKNAIYPEFEQHVENHEFGHNLFYRNDSDLEESKPSLFHCLKLLDEMKSKEFPESRLKACIDFFLLDFMRDIQRGYHNYKNNPIYKYVLYSRCVLKNFFDVGLIRWESDTKLQVEYDMGKFEKFLYEMELLLLEIKKIYENPEKKGEVEFISLIEESTQSHFDAIGTLLGLKK